MRSMASTASYCSTNGRLVIATTPSGKTKRQHFGLKQGIDRDTAKRLVKLIKDTKIKVQSQIQGDQIRVTGKKRDDLQSVMAGLKEAELDIPLSFDNFRD